MKITQQLKSAVEAFRTTNNSAGTGSVDPNAFLKYGNKRALVQDWARVVMTDKEMYTGYPYASIDRRANKVASLAKYNLKTDATKEVQKQFKDKKEEVRHPYLDIIDKSKTFANRKFWYDISTYLDLEGVYYLLAVRTVEQNEQSLRVGNVVEFKLLNPYNVRRIINEDTLEVGGYVESRKGLVREIPPQMIIEMRKLNPFDEDDPFSMSDAAKTAQFTLKQGGDYTRHSLKNNMAAPGIISTDVLLDPQQFANFVSRVTNQEKGLPLFGNGAGAITWDSMQIDIDKAGLKDISEINRQELFAVSGAGKTMLSIEESGTTRDTAEVQGDLFVEYHAQPQLELILDALNQDYKIHYQAEYEKSKFALEIVSPLGVDLEAEKKEIEIRKESYEVYNTLVNKGYERDVAARYAQGEMTLEELGEPKNPPVMSLPITQPVAEPPVKKDPKKEDDPIDQHFHDSAIVVRNEFDEESQGIITNQQGALQNAVENLEARVVNSVIRKVTKNEFDTQTDIMSESEKRDYEQELELALAAFYGVIIPLYATSTLNKRAKEFGLVGNFKMNSETKTYIKTVAGKAATSHINTILDDLLKATKTSFDKAVKSQLDAIEATGRAITDADLKLARKKALEGASQAEIVSAIKDEYSGHIAPNRAKAIARTETNRAFTQSQYQADIQFLQQNDLTSKAYKKWITTSDNPCAICQELAAQAPIPFSQNFADLGDELKATYTDDKGKTKVLSQVINFEALSAGNAHVNCGCKYMLIIE